jgi:hypothetical protein
LTIFISNTSPLSHLHERKEKTCLNCGASLTGRYCSDCGQENVEPKESAWHLIVHFFNDITHFDGKFFLSLKYLLFRPGFLTEEYVKGRRVSYLNPIRMYLFISALFFLLYVSFFMEGGNMIRTTEIHNTADSSTGLKIRRNVKNTLRNLDSAMAAEDSKHIVLNTGDTLSRTQLNNYEPKTTAEYDSIQKALPAAERDGSIIQAINKKIINLQQHYGEDKAEMMHRFKANFAHSLPYMLFLSLPLIALLLRLLYVRRKQFYYVSHGIFTIHYYCLVFLALLLAYTLEKFGGWGPVVGGIIRFGTVVYLYAAMYRFYKQGWFKTFIKFILLLFAGGTIVGILMVIFLIYSLWNVV